MIAVIFEVKIATSKQGKYLSLASHLRTLLNNIDGFISIERFQSLAAEGKLLSLSWWKNEDAILQWKNNILHAKAQQEGKYREVTINEKGNKAFAQYFNITI